jgi:hypothetical protein
MHLAGLYLSDQPSSVKPPSSSSVLYSHQPTDRPPAGSVPASALPDLMRAAGFYPSRTEIAALTSHVRFLAGLQAEAGGAAAGTAGAAGGSAGRGESVDWGTFLSLYLNHRPLAGVGHAGIEAAFAALGATAASGGALDGRQLLGALQRGGDKMGAEEVARILQVLTGAADPSEALGGLVTPLSFAADVLGFGIGAAADAGFDATTADSSPAALPG